VSPEHSPAQENSLGLNMTWLRELWRWLMIRGLKKPCSLGWVTMHCKVILGFDTCWRVKFYGGIVSVGHRLNLWCKPISLRVRHWFGISTADQDGQIRQLLMQTDCEMSKLKFHLTHYLTWYDAMDGPIIIRRVTLQYLICMNTITYRDAWQVITRRMA